MPTIATERIENRRDGKRAVVLVPTFCPFCGVKYPQRSEFGPIPNRPRQKKKAKAA